MTLFGKNICISAKSGKYRSYITWWVAKYNVLRFYDQLQLLDLGLYRVHKTVIKKLQLTETLGNINGDGLLPCHCWWQSHTANENMLDQKEEELYWTNLIPSIRRAFSKFISWRRTFFCLFNYKFLAILIFATWREKMVAHLNILQQKLMDIIPLWNNF